jgi:hypothetical protein
VKKTMQLACALALTLAAWPVGLTAAAPRCYPSIRFALLDGALVRDTLTKLVWQRQASTTTMSWADAKTYCSSAGSGFRLPTVKELRSIVNESVTSEPKIDQAAFPNTPPEYFWTSSPYVGSPGDVWYVNFGISAFGSGWSPEVSTYRARCVR